MEQKKLKWEFLGQKEQEMYIERAQFLIDREYLKSDKDTDVETIAKNMYYRADDSGEDKKRIERQREAWGLNDATASD